MRRVLANALMLVLVLCLLVALPSSAQTPTPTLDATATATAPGVGMGVDQGVIAAFEGTVTSVYQRLIPSVVNIQMARQAPSSLLPDVPFGQPPEVQRGVGSGFVWDTEGHVVTNYHVVAGADLIQVTFQDGTTVEAEVVGTDPDSDLAVIRVDVPAEQLVPVEVADSTQVQVGQLAIAIGNPFGLQGSLTLGVVSAVGRLLPVGTSVTGGSQYSVPDVIQTDAPINPGNSGGVLVDAQGRLIGVPTSIISPAGVSAGVGFAVPSRIVAKVVPSLIETGQYQHPYIGITGTTLNPALAEAMGLPERQRGALVIAVTPGGPADEAGLRGGEEEVQVMGTNVPVGGDVIVAVGGEQIRGVDDLITYLSRHTEVGQTVPVTVLREGEPMTVEVTLQARPREQEAQVSPGPTVPAGPRLGVVGVELTPAIAEAMGLPEDQEGVLVQSVQPGSPADEAGIRGGSEPATVDGQRLLLGGDVIVAVDGEPVAQPADVRALLAERQPGDEVTVTLLRDGEEMEVQVTLAEVAR
ncbi:MAG: PDZ domain-containing protein [Anaerolineae bacterium]|nr:PDZ domain-containing protein [Anaerolineae bacterium]